MYWESPAVKKVLDCNSREGETVDGRLVDNFAPDVVIARFINGTASSILVSSFFMSLMISLISVTFCIPPFPELDALRFDSSAAAAFASRCPRACISHLRDFVRATADSSDVFPRAALHKRSAS